MQLDILNHYNRLFASNGAVAIGTGRFHTQRRSKLCKICTDSRPIQQQKRHIEIFKQRNNRILRLRHVQYKVEASNKATDAQNDWFRPTSAQQAARRRVAQGQTGQRRMHHFVVEQCLQNIVHDRDNKETIGERRVKVEITRVELADHDQRASVAKR